MFGAGAALGCDFARTVIEFDNGVQRFSVGDLVASTVWGGKFLGE